MIDNECACKDGYYFDGVNKECQCKLNWKYKKEKINKKNFNKECDISCINCTGPDKYSCTSCGDKSVNNRDDFSTISGGSCPCQDGYYDNLIDNKCICPNSYLDSSKQCQPCHYTCL